MFLYIYVDYFALYKPGLIDNLRAGVVFEFDISPTLLTMMLASVAIPALMVMLSMTLPVRGCTAPRTPSATRTTRSALRPRPSPAASGPGHSWVEVRPTARGVRWWPSDQPRQPA